MPTQNEDLFQRLRRAGIRKQVAKTLSELSGDAGKKAVSAGHRAVAELRLLAAEIEKRLPAATPEPTLETQSTPKLAARPSSPAKTAAPKTASKATPKATPKTAPKKAPRSPRPAAKARPASASASPAPRGENKAKILAVLQGGPRTASEIGQEAGIATATVSAALTRMSKSGEVTKAARGYALPG